MPTVCGEEEVGRVLALEPPDLVDLLLNLQGLEVVELGLVLLQGGESSGFVSPTLGTRFDLLDLYYNILGETFQRRRTGGSKDYPLTTGIVYKFNARQSNPQKEEETNIYGGRPTEKYGSNVIWILKILFKIKL